jgi:sugar lactone lactonase YvrE
MEASGFTGFGRMYELAPNGKTRLLADITAHEVRYNPDGMQIDSNPYGVTILSNGDRIVADAGGNSIVRYHANGTTSTVAAFGLLDPAPFAPSCQLPPEAGLPPVGTPIPAEAVPTSVAQGPDGAIYVGTLSGFPFAEKNARIYRIDPKTGAVSQYGPNLTLVVGIAFAPDGTLYATQITGNSDAFFCNDAVPGALVKVTETSATVVTELPLPGGIAIDKAGNAYVSVFSVLPGAGEVWKIRL